MDWWNLLLFAAGALAGYGFRPKGKQESRSQDTIISSRASASDRSNLLHAYSPELKTCMLTTGEGHAYVVVDGWALDNRFPMPVREWQVGCE